ncbi:hypothetical protein [Paenibacillus qinlingensis]|uniref:Membrane protein implicated in regulation of membrane protease activity n=1 Tax=Paenibacillus qinlingensis TaxID=1837343 RepID=A0ABU1P3F2_9BACL|nr:hypothetical protein [Paenibacillus qinlingensis]MDR6553742.1 membrane protein implicated in regulation of membrane protease activity [Paenibacillus qinlingensis]
MLKRKVIWIYMKNLSWFLPIVILIIGANPSIAGSFWWKLLGFLLFVGIVALCVSSWIQANREQREIDENKHFDPVVFRQFN